MNEKAVEALKAARAADSQRKRDAVLQALADAGSEAAPITMSSIAERAGVSRPFLYSHTDLKAAVEAAARAIKPTAQATRAKGDLEQGFRADRRTLLAKVERQRATIGQLRERVAELEQQRQRWLGSQLEAHVAIDPVEHSDLRAAADRLMDDNIALKRKVAEHQRLNSIYESDLAAVRQALAEALTDQAAPHSNVTGPGGKRHQP